MLYALFWYMLDALVYGSKYLYLTFKTIIICEKESEAVPCIKIVSKKNGARLLWFKSKRREQTRQVQKIVGTPVKINKTGKPVVKIMAECSIKKNNA